MVYLGTAFFPVVLANSVHEAPNLQHWHLSVYFLLQLRVIVCVPGSVAIHLLVINIESTGFRPNSMGFKLVSGTDSRFGRINEEGGREAGSLNYFCDCLKKKYFVPYVIKSDSFFGISWILYTVKVKGNHKLPKHTKSLWK